MPRRKFCCFGFCICHAHCTVLPQSSISLRSTLGSRDCACGGGAARIFCFSVLPLTHVLHSAAAIPEFSQPHRQTKQHAERLISFLCTSRMRFVTYESSEALLAAAHTDEGKGAARVGNQHGIRPELKCSSSNLICSYIIIPDDAHVPSGSSELAGLRV